MKNNIIQEDMAYIANHALPEAIRRTARWYSANKQQKVGQTLKEYPVEEN